MTNPQPTSYPTVKKAESISAKARNQTGMPTLTTFIQHSFGSPSQRNQKIKRNKRDVNLKRSKIVCLRHDTSAFVNKNFNSCIVPTFIQ